MRVALLLLLLLPASANSLAAHHRANPIRQVVGLLQGLQKEVEEEGRKEKDLYDKFMCYCQGNDGQLKKDIAGQEARIDALTSATQELTASNGQLDQDIQELEDDIADNEKAVAEATGVREKEAKDFATESAELESCLDALGKAIPAIQRGQDTAAALPQLTSELADRTPITQSGRNQNLLHALLQESAGSSPASSQILGILQQMEDSFKEDLENAKATEKSALATFAELERAKKAEISSAVSRRDEKKARVAEQKLALATAEEDLEDTTAASAEDKEFAANLAESCDTKTKQWDARQQSRAAEVQAISEAIKILNDDDSLDLFKKTLSKESPPPAFVQTKMRVRARVSMRLRAKARALEKVMRSKIGSAYGSAQHIAGMSAIVQSMKSTSLSPAKFDGIKSMVEAMVVNLEREQDEDDAHFSYCEDELSAKATKRDKLNEELGALENKITNTQSAIETSDEELAALKAEIAALDQSVTDATEDRKEEHTEYTSTMSELQLAVNLLLKAKSRLAAFYAPNAAAAYPTPAPSPPQEQYVLLQTDVHSAPATKKDEDSPEAFLDFLGIDPNAKPAPAPAPAPATPAPTTFLGLGLSFVQVRRTGGIIEEFLQAATGAGSGTATATNDRPEPPPTFGDNYEKKTGKGMGVMGLLSELITDSKIQQTEAKANEETAQRNYEKLMNDSQGSREAKANAVADKETERVHLLEVMEEAKEEKAGDIDEFKAVADNFVALHKSCDFLIQNYDFRKKARSEELDGLKQGMAVLSGASYGAETGFLQAREN
jgi:predicted  nucleic acid-binding Zn-ribbon protein